MALCAPRHNSIFQTHHSLSCNTLTLQGFVGMPCRTLARSVKTDLADQIRTMSKGHSMSRYKALLSLSLKMQETRAIYCAFW